MLHVSKARIGSGRCSQPDGRSCRKTRHGSSTRLPNPHKARTEPSGSPGSLSADLVSTPPRLRGRVGRRTLALFSFLAVSLAAAAPTASAQVLKKLDFETGGFRQWTSKQALPGRIDIVPSPVRQGQFASRFTVKPGDDPVPGGERAELMYWSHERAGKTSWWRWSTYFPRGFHPNGGAWNIFTQWHQTGDKCSPPVRFMVDKYMSPPRLRLDVWGGRLNTKPAPRSTGTAGTSARCTETAGTTSSSSSSGRRANRTVSSASASTGRSRAEAHGDPLPRHGRLPEAGLLPRRVVENDDDHPRRDAALQALT